MRLASGQRAAAERRRGGEAVSRGSRRVGGTLPTRLPGAPGPRLPGETSTAGGRLVVRTLRMTSSIFWDRAFVIAVKRAAVCGVLPRIAPSAPLRH